MRQLIAHLPLTLNQTTSNSFKKKFEQVYSLDVQSIIDKYIEQVIIEDITDYTVYKVSIFGSRLIKIYWFDDKQKHRDGEIIKYYVPNPKEIFTRDRN